MGLSRLSKNNELMKYRTIGKQISDGIIMIKIGKSYLDDIKRADEKQAMKRKGYIE